MQVVGLAWEAAWQILGQDFRGVADPERAPAFTMGTELDCGVGPSRIPSGRHQRDRPMYDRYPNLETRTKIVAVNNVHATC